MREAFERAYAKLQSIDFEQPVSKGKSIVQTAAAL